VRKLHPPCHSSPTSSILTSERWNRCFCLALNAYREWGRVKKALSSVGIDQNHHQKKRTKMQEKKKKQKKKNRTTQKKKKKKYPQKTKQPPNTLREYKP